MQTLRKRTSPFKYKNDASKFMGEGITFKAKLIGILEVSEARGDKMCQDALNDLKTAIRAAGEHKQRITIGISIDGLRLRDEKTGESLYHHPVHKISFIAQDMSDSRAFGYIFGSPDIGHRFFGIKTDKTASQVVIAMRDLFQVVFELKKKEIELAKHQSDHHHVKYASTGILDVLHFTKEDAESDKGKGKMMIKSRGCTSKAGDSESKGAATSEAIADLLDLEHELNSIQQGINQMDKITPPDPFGPLAKNDPYADPFDDSFPAKVDKSVTAPTTEDKTTSVVETSFRKPPEDSSEQEKQSSFFGATTSATKTNFFSQLSSGIAKPKLEESWFHPDTESLFNETTNVGNAEPTSSPIALTTPAPEPDQTEDKRSPGKLDLFTELDPLGTGRVKPYVDKKDFFQELKNPPKKVLKELITENVSTEPSTPFTFPATFKEEPPGSAPAVDSKEEPRSSVVTKTDFFVGGDPFEKTDPFQEENFSSGFSPMFGAKASVEGLFEDKSWGFGKPSSKEAKDERPGKSSPSNLLFTSPLRVSLPPEKSESYGAVSGPFSKSPLSTPEELKNIRRKYYQVSKQWTLDGSEDSPVHEEPFVSTRIINYHGRADTERRSPFKEKFYSVQSPPPSARGEKSSFRMHSSLDRTSPDPSLRGKSSALFTIKPPPLPGKKQNQPSQRTATRTQSKEDNTYPYDYLESKETVCNGFHSKEELKCVKLKKQLFTGKNSPPATELRKQNSDSKDANFPVLPPPPNRKSSTDAGKMTAGRKSHSGTGGDGSVLNLKLNQLDNTGLESLAITLGIPSENIYSMTLQELTKMLADKYLKGEETKTENPKSDTFEVDFEANFAKMEMASQNSQSSYDKYAVFKELIENENRGSEDVREDEKEEREEGRSGDIKTFTQTKEEEDKYAALRQLSLNTEAPSQEMEEEEEVKPEIAFVVEESKEDSISPGPSQLGAGTLDMDDKSQSLENIDEKIEEGSLAQKAEVEKTPDQETRKETHFDSEQNLFPLVDEFSDDKKPISPRDNWATFEKSDFGEGGIEEEKKAEVGGDENENSPFSSDGREEVREIPFRWHQDSYRGKKRGDVPWRDDDESWDDYSPKESYCSDESSHEERSPEGGRGERYSSSSWREFCGGKGSKTERWNRRDKWQEETEDEFEENWRKHRERLGSYDSERRTFRHSNNYENFSKRYDRCNSRGTEPWNEEERLVHTYGTRRKRSESDADYRKRCDSDASDKECVWSVQKSYHDGHGRSSGKQKSHHGPGHSFRSCPEHCHESRSKHRKGTGQKRPSSASETNRNYEKMFSPSDYGYKSAEKSYPGKRESEKEDYQRYEHSWKESRHRVDAEYPHSYSSFDRKAHHSKGSSRGSRGSNSGQSDAYPSPSPNKREGPEVGYFEAFADKGYKYNKPETGRHFQFEPEPDNFEKPKKSSSDPSRQDFSPKRRGNQWASANGKTEGEVFFPGRPSEENFADFRDDFKTSPKRSKGEGTSRGAFPPTETVVPQAKSRAHSAAILSGQEPPPMALRKSDSINIFSRDKDPFEDDDFFESAS